MSSTSKVYFITGCSSGLGYHLAKTALTAGHRVIATSRNPSRTPDRVKEIESLGGHWAILDVASPDLESQFKDLLELVDGNIDVLINNAGVAMGSVVEDTDVTAARNLFETNFFGVVRLTQLVLPLMRAQGSGSIVNVSSNVALTPMPNLAVYAASKSAVDAFTEALKMEVAAFNIRVFLVHPGDMRTDFKGNAGEPTPLKDGYKGTVADFVLQSMTGNMGKEKIDPEKAARTVVEAVDGTGSFAAKGHEFLRLPLGFDTLGGIEERVKELTACTEAFGAVARSVDHEP